MAKEQVWGAREWGLWRRGEVDCQEVEIGDRVTLTALGAARRKAASLSAGTRAGGIDIFPLLFSSALSLCLSTPVTSGSCQSVEGFAGTKV